MAAVTDAGEISESSSGTAARASSHACVCSDLLGTCRHSVQFKDWCLQALCCSNGPNLIKLEHLPNSIYSKREKGQSKYQQPEKEGFPNSQILGNCSCTEVISYEQNGGENMERQSVKSSVIYNYRFPSDNKINWEL